MRIARCEYCREGSKRESVQHPPFPAAPLGVLENRAEGHHPSAPDFLRRALARFPMSVIPRRRIHHRSIAERLRVPVPVRRRCPHSDGLRGPSSLPAAIVRQTLSRVPPYFTSGRRMRIHRRRSRWSSRCWTRKGSERRRPTDRVWRDARRRSMSEQGRVLLVRRRRDGRRRRRRREIVPSPLLRPSERIGRAGIRRSGRSCST